MRLYLLFCLMVLSRGWRWSGRAGWLSGLTRANSRASDSSSVRRPETIMGPVLNWSGVRVRYLMRYWQPPGLEQLCSIQRERPETRSSSEVICREERHSTACTTWTSSSSQAGLPAM